MKLLILFSFALSSTLFGAGYQIPNNSLNAQALSTAYVANAQGADTTYYNPANMLYNENSHSLEISLNAISLEAISYDSADNNFYIKSRKTLNFIPSLHYVSKKLGKDGIRVGLSIVSPAGLTRQWDEMPASATAKKYALSTVEFNPTIALPLSEKLSFALGLRYLIAQGEIALDAQSLYALEMKGSGEATGYNLALSYRFSDTLKLSTTYRSKISLQLKGDGDARLGATSYYSKASIAAPIPANFIVAIAYTFPTKTTVEFTYDKTFWSIVTETNFEFENPILEATLGKSVEKRWHDTTVYRVGLTQQFDTLKTMAGFSYSPSAAQEEFVTFSSPETDFITFSLGSKYEINNNFEVGVAALYAKGQERKISQPTKPLGINGTLGKRDIITLSIGFEYSF